MPQLRTTWVAAEMAPADSRVDRNRGAVLRNNATRRPPFVGRRVANTDIASPQIKPISSLPSRLEVELEPRLHLAWSNGCIGPTKGRTNKSTAGHLLSRKKTSLNRFN